MTSRKLSRREFLGMASAAAAGVVFAGCTPGSPDKVAPTIRPTFGMDPTQLDTTWPIKRVVYVMLENRSFDNMFGAFPGVEGTSMGVAFGDEKPLIPCPDWLPGDIPHDLSAHLKNENGGAQDGFAIGAFGDPYAYSQFSERDIPAYWKWAREYAICDHFFASQAGPSFANHLWFVAGSAGGAIENPENIKVRREPGGKQFKSWGCDAYGPDVFVFVQDEHGHITKHDTCFRLPNMGEKLSERDIDWAFYSAKRTQPGYIWQAYSAIESVYHNEELWSEHIWPVDDLMRDVHAGALPSVTWVTPRFQLSDHPPYSTRFAHNWVVDLVNGIMDSDMWEHTAIFLTWDEWGGFYDHVPIPKLPNDPWNLGFRVPTLVISPYARRGAIYDEDVEFTAPLRFIADNWGIDPFTHRMSTSPNMEALFDFTRKPRKNPAYGDKVNTTTKDAFDFPENYGGWDPGTTPMPPAIGS
jgi:phospholipase C